MSVSQKDIERGLRELGLDENSHVLVHSSYKAFNGVDGGPKAVVDALMNTANTLMMPASTWVETSVWDKRGLVEGNAYMPEAPVDARAEPFAHDTPIDRNIGVIAETFRTSYDVRRSAHPIQSFIAHGTLADDLTTGPGEDFSEPIRRLMEAGGDLLLMGVSHKSSTTIHLAEQLAGRQLFTRYALTTEGAVGVTCGGCGNRFNDLQPNIEHLERSTTVGQATLRRYRLQPYVEAARAMIERDSNALLCDCSRCDAHRSRVPA